MHGAAARGLHRAAARGLHREGRELRDHGVPRLRHASGQAWADFDVYMPDRWARDRPRRRAAGIPDDLVFATKPDLAVSQLERLAAAGLPLRRVAADEV